jgi:AraC family transcriptional regulator
MNISVAADAFSPNTRNQPAAGKTDEICEIAEGGIVISRVQSDHSDLEKKPIAPRADAFNISVQLRALEKVKWWRGGKLVSCGGQPQASLSIADLTQSWQVHYLSPFDTVHFHIPFCRLSRFSEEAGRPLFRGLACDDAQHDPVMFGLAQALLPSLNNPQAANLLFIERINLAALAHLTQSYGGVFFPNDKKGTLAPWQERRVKAFLEANFSQPIGIADLADICELSRSYFIKAFKESFGQTPYRWLSEYRVSRARDMLLGEHSIAEIAIDCGFADQSHMTRIFTEFMGLAPGQFRRQNRSDLIA